jgi:hypothetical protein
MLSASPTKPALKHVFGHDKPKQEDLFRVPSQSLPVYSTLSDSKLVTTDGTSFHSSGMWSTQAAALRVQPTVPCNVPGDRPDLSLPGRFFGNTIALVAITQPLVLILVHIAIREIRGLLKQLQITS